MRPKALLESVTELLPGGVWRPRYKCLAGQGRFQSVSGMPGPVRSRQDRTGKNQFHILTSTVELDLHKGYADYISANTTN